MTVQLSQKEKMLLQDQKKHEEVCIEKYTNYANQAQDPQLQQIFNTYAEQEKQHKNTVEQILNGQVPQMNQQQNQQQSQQQYQQQYQQQNQQTAGQTQGQTQGTAGQASEQDASLCKDMLMTEKFVSGSYDDAIFQFNDSCIRQALNHIQKEEQQHGEGIITYMEQNNIS